MISNLPTEFMSQNRHISPQQNHASTVVCPGLTYYIKIYFMACQAYTIYPSFRAALPLCHLLYGTSSQLTHHFPGREAEVVQFIDGLSQGCPSGTVLTVLGLYFGLHLVLTKHPAHLAVRILGIIDDFKLLGRIHDIIIIYFDLQRVTVLKDLFGVTLNLKKSSLLCLQLHTILDPVSSLEPIDLSKFLRCNLFLLLRREQ
jgi:hypothetical protein